MEEEKTLLQQIREKEQEYAQKLAGVKSETDTAVAAAKEEAENLLCTADSAGQKEAEQLYWQEKVKIEAEIEELKKSAAEERGAAAARAERNVPRAAEAIAGLVKMDREM